MKAIRFDTAVPRNALGRALVKRVPSRMIGLGRLANRIYPALMWSGWMNTYLDEIPEPQLPSDDWVKIKTRYGGICGTDVSTIHLDTSPYYSAFASFPLTFGHENVGHISQVGARAQDWRAGERVVVEPILWCVPRGFTDLCPPCARGEINLCERMANGALAPGLLIGGCRDTGGSWGEYFLAHRSQLYRVPENVSDENALLVEPFAVGLHAAIQNFPRDDETVLILGAGAIGLLTLAALRALGARARILVIARYDFQADAARRLGASDIICGKRDCDYYQDIATLTQAQLLKPLFGKLILAGGGVDSTFESVGTDETLDDAMRLTRERGKVVLVGVPGIAEHVDWTSIFTKELDVSPAYTYHHVEEWNGKKWKAFDLALELMATGRVDLGWMVTHRFKLDEYRRAFGLLERRGASKAIKAVFEFE